ncbi:hypothetical protein [Clostridium novyi]|uniref:hypothetical protein n=1 Tax=Clostridium novyi TaxID=1542 RepID=UPI000AF64DBC|nr:hypothetical protein [Clostridium novyi]
MLSVPVSNEQILMRLLSLVIGSVFIMILQLICNKHRLVKSTNKSIESIFQELINKNEAVISKEDYNCIDISIEKEIKNDKKTSIW